MIHARIEYLRICKKPFILDACYELYKHEPGYDYTKFTDEPPTPPTPPVVVEDVDNNDEMEGGTRTNNTDDAQTKKQRGPGKKNLKALKQAKYDGTSSDSFESIFNESNDKFINYLKEQKAAKAQQAIKENEMLDQRRKDKVKERDEKVMMANWSKLSPVGQEWLEKKQQEILEKNSSQ